jgi:type I restriction enzyme R subunit
LWDIFKTIANKRDAEAYQQLLKDEAIRVLFYDKLAAFAKGLKLALSSIQFHKEVEEKNQSLQRRFDHVSETAIGSSGKIQ